MRTDIELSIKPMFVTIDKSGPIIQLFVENLRSIYVLVYPVWQFELKQDYAPMAIQHVFI